MCHRKREGKLQPTTTTFGLDKSNDPGRGIIFEFVLASAFLIWQLLAEKISNCGVKWTQVAHWIRDRTLHSHESLKLFAFSLSFNCCPVASHRGCVLVKHPTGYTKVSFPISRNWKQHSSAFFTNCICEKQSEKCIQDTNLWFSFFCFKALRFGVKPKFGFYPPKISCEHLVGLVVGLFLCFLHNKLYSWSHVT